MVVYFPYHLLSRCISFAICSFNEALGRRAIALGCADLAQVSVLSGPLLSGLGL